MKLYLVRHGKTDSSVVQNPPLSQMGKKECEAVAKFLSTKNLKISTIYHSTKLRAQQTADLFKKEGVLSALLVEKEGMKPDDSAHDFFKEMSVWKQDSMIVSHLPFLTELLSILVTGTSHETLVDLSCGCVICLKTSPTGWTIDWVITPELFVNSFSQI